tara:strand:+ start:5582 stop:5854 length:273 start_codon:yes stop_codon:yes gene_type:complete
MKNTRNSRYVEEHLWAHDLYGQLIGFEIVDFYMEEVGFDDEEYDIQDDAWPTFIIENKSTKERLKLVLSRDPEGNGAGFAFVEGMEDDRT